MPTPTIVRRMRDLPDFEMAPDSPDVRGWSVRGGDGQPLGTVAELLVSPENRQVLYLNVALATGLPDVPAPAPHADNHILLPVAAVHLDAEGHSVFITALRRDTIASYPPFIDFMLPPDFEAAMQQALEQ